MKFKNVIRNHLMRDHLYEINQELKSFLVNRPPMDVEMETIKAISEKTKQLLKPRGYRNVTKEI